MSDQQPPGNGNTPAEPSPGWYPDPNGFQALRWWDGSQWGSQTRPPPGLRQEPQPPYPDPTASASHRFGVFGQQSPGWAAEQGDPQDDGLHTPGSYPASFPPARPQQFYAPGAQPQAHRARRPKNRKAQGALIGLGALIGFIVIIAAATRHNSPSAGNIAATSTTSAAAPVASSAAASSPPDCRSQVISWRDDGGVSQLDTVMADMGNVQTSATSLGTDLSTGADASGDEVSLQTAAASLQSDSETAQANLPPSCVRHLRANYRAALNDAFKAALDCQDAVSELGSGNDNVATEMNAADAAITASGRKFQAATSDVQAFSGG